MDASSRNRTELTAGYNILSVHICVVSSGVSMDTRTYVRTYIIIILRPMDLQILSIRWTLPEHGE